MLLYSEIRVTLFFVFLAASVLGSGLFPQTSNYQLTFSSAKIERTNPAFVGPGAFFRVTLIMPAKRPALNTFIPFVQDLPANTNASWRTFTKIRNRWSETLVRGHLNFCSLLEAKLSTYNLMFSASNFPPKCPVKKGNYSIVDFTYELNSKILPTVVVGDHWKVQSWWTTDDDLILNFVIELKVERDTRR